MPTSPRARALVAAILCLVVVGLLAYQVRVQTDLAAKRMGFFLEPSERGLILDGVVSGMPADRAGLNDGDRLLSINGILLETTLDYDRAAATFERGEPASFTVVQDGVERRLEVVPGAPVDWPALGLSFVALVAYLGLALFVLAQGSGDRRSQLLFLFAAAVAVELALPWEVIATPTLGAVLVSLFYLLSGFQLGVELHLASVIPRRYGWLRRRPWLVPLYYVFGLGFGGLAAVTLVVEEALGHDLFPWSVIHADELLLQVGMPVWAVGVVAILALQIAVAQRPRERQQAGLVLTGVLPWAGYVVLLTGFALGDALVDQALVNLESLVLLAYPVAVFVAIYRYRLFDLELVVRRSLVYTLLTGIVVLLFYGALGAGGVLFSGWLEGEPSLWLVAAATLGLGLLFSPLRRFLHRWIGRRVFPERHALRERLVDLAAELPGQGKLPRMGDHLVERMATIFAVRSVTLAIATPRVRALGILAATGSSAHGAEVTGELGRGSAESETVSAELLSLDDPAVAAVVRAGRPLFAGQVEARGLDASSLRSRGVTLAVPLECRGEIIGLLMLGPKHGRERFPAEELELLNLLAHHVAIVFQNARLFESATYESLTGLLRREAILGRLEDELVRARRYDRPLTVGMADLDHFKEVNDRYGHLAGDSLLRKVSRVLSSGLRSTDAVGRYGGEEFLLVLPETDLAGGRAVADKLRQLVEGERLTMEDGVPVGVTVSIGLACLEHPELPEHPTVRDLLSLADEALYEAKQGGRNRIHPPSIAQVG